MLASFFGITTFSSGRINQVETDAAFQSGLSGSPATRLSFRSCRTETFGLYAFVEGLVSAAAGTLHAIFGRTM